MSDRNDTWALISSGDIPEERDEGYAMTGLSEPLDLVQLRANLFRFRPGDRMEYHDHDWQEELLYIVDGACTLVVEGERHEVTVGDVVRFSPLPRRQIVNEGPGDCVWFAVGAPPVDDDWNEFDEGTTSDIPGAAEGWSVLHAADLEPKVRDRYVIYWLTEPLGLQQLRANLFRFRPGDSMYSHAHKAQEEVFYVLEGEADLVVGDERRRMKAGDLARVDKEPPRQLVQAGDAECVWLAVAAPPVDDDVIWFEK